MWTSFLVSYPRHFRKLKKRLQEPKTNVKTLAFNSRSRDFSYFSWQDNMVIQRRLCFFVAATEFYGFSSMVHTGYFFLGNKNHSPWGSSSVWFDCMNCRSGAHYTFLWWGNTFRLWITDHCKKEALELEVLTVKGNQDFLACPCTRQEYLFWMN